LHNLCFISTNHKKGCHSSRMATFFLLDFCKKSNIAIYNRISGFTGFYFLLCRYPVNLVILLVFKDNILQVIYNRISGFTGFYFLLCRYLVNLVILLVFKDNILQVIYNRISGFTGFYFLLCRHPVNLVILLVFIRTKF
jgi:hypothetical protein